MAGRPFICGLVKVKDELVRDSNLYRCLDNMMEFCDTIVACDDASTDGTDLVLREFFVKHGIPLSQLLTIPLADHAFEKELAVKQRMLQRIKLLRPHWIWWQDGDEVLPAPQGGRLREWLTKRVADPNYEAREAFRFPYVQLWRNGFTQRMDDGFADGSFVKLWRWAPDLTFDVVEKTHHMQFPINVGEIHDAPVGSYVLHFGNWGKNLQFKCTQYYGGLGGVERHMDFEHASFSVLAYDYAKYPAIEPVPAHTKSTPHPFTNREKSIIKSMKNLRALPGWFTVVIPTFNRASFLRETLQSLLRQTYAQWIALVLDDGSTDGTAELMHKLALVDPRILYARHPKRGAVAMNEIGMAFACAATEWWTRLGSDDYFEPNKLLHDSLALAEAEWCYGPYRVLRRGTSPTGEDIPIWQLDELCNMPESGAQIRKQLLDGQFRVSWANIAARTSLLRAVKQSYSTFCDPGLENMEDFLVNVRMARLAEPVFRAATKSGNLLIAKDAKTVGEAAALQLQLEHDAIWRVNPVGASSTLDVTARDETITRELIKKENEQ